MAEENKVLGIRLDVEERKRFDDFVAEEGKNNKDFLNTLLNLYELNKGKVKNINLVGDIETLEGYTNKIQQAFINVIEKLESQKGDITENSQKDLKIYKDKVNELQDKISIIMALNSTNEEKLTTAINDNIALKEQNNQLQQIQESSNALNEEYKGKIDMLLGQMKQFEKFPEQLEATKVLLSDSQIKNISLNDDIKDKEFTIRETTKNIEALNQEKLKEVDILKKELIFDKDKSILELKQLHQVELEKTQDRYNKQIEKYQADYKALLEKLELMDHAKKSSTKAATKTVKDM